MNTWAIGAGAGGGGGGGGGGGAAGGGGGGATTTSHAAVAARHVTTTSSTSWRDAVRRYVMGKRTPCSTTRFYLRYGTAYSPRISADSRMAYVILSEARGAKDPPPVFNANAGQGRFGDRAFPQGGTPATAPRSR